MAFQNPAFQGEYRGAAVTKTTAGVFIPQLWSTEVQRQRDAGLIISKYVKTITGQFSKGSRLHIPKIGRAAVNVKLPETPVLLQGRTENEFTVDIDRYVESSFMIEDIVKIQSSYDLRAEYAREHGYALARDIDNYILALRAVVNNSDAQVVYSKNGTVSNPLDYASLLQAKLKLDAKSVPQEDRVLIVSPEGYNQLLAVDRFISMDYRNTASVQSGQVGTIFGMPVIMSSNMTANGNFYFNGENASAQASPGAATSPYLPTQDTFKPLPTAWSAAGVPLNGAGTPVVTQDTANGASSNVYTAIMLHKDFAVMGMQKAPSVESSRETLMLADAVVMSQLYGGRIYRPDHAVIIHHDDSITLNQL